MFKNKYFSWIFPLLFLLPSTVVAASIENVAETITAGDYVIGPGKNELWLDPGDSGTRNLMVTNRYGKDMVFKIQIEDFRGSRQVGENIVLLGQEKGPYSLRDFLHTETTDFILKHGQRISIPIEITVPADAQPGGLYGAVIVVAQPVLTPTTPSDRVITGNLTVISRLASLFFVRVNGAAKEDGFLKEFTTSQYFYTMPQISLRALYENNGNVYLNPYGFIEIKNILGTKIDEIKIDPYFVMPDAIRLKEFNLERPFMFGWYRAHIFLNRGYGDIVDEKAVNFLVLPWKIVAGVLLGVSLLILSAMFIFNWFKNNFEIKRKM